MMDLLVCYYARLRQFASEIVLIGRSRDYLCIIISKFDALFDAFPLSLRWFDKKVICWQQLSREKIEISMEGSAIIIGAN